ncbi:MAG: hypothetical protein ABR886_01935 [Dehalococcoidales bacterium]|jgi:hypothetical protein
MKLKPTIASYSGEITDKIEAYLNDRVLDIIAGVAVSPKNRETIPPDVLTELLAMHIFKEKGQLVMLDTTVFLEKDIKMILETVTPLAQELSCKILDCGGGLHQASPEITSFLGGVIGVGQGMGSVIAKENIGVDWKHYTGKYARSKTDFDEICPAYSSMSPDYLNKSVIQGERYTAVFIGPIGQAFKTFTFDMNSTDLSRRYREDLNKFLVDAYAKLITGEIQNQALLRSAQTANLYKHSRWRTVVITNDIFQKYENSVNLITEAVTAYYGEKMDDINKLLIATSGGRNGVPPANMILHFWRYIRRTTAAELYRNGFLIDTIPEEGTLTVFYENNVGPLRRLLI